MKIGLFLAATLAATTPYQYFLTGSGTDIQRPTHAGFALIGGAKDVDEFYKWMIARSGGGDLIVIRASGGDGYNDYLYQLGGLNSVQTLVIANREAANNHVVAERIQKAEALFIAGGDQWKYVSLWNHSPIGAAIQDAIKRGIPIGGTSAGLAILGEYVFTAEKDTVNSNQALANPFDEHVTIGSNFVDIPFLKNTITDTHFRARNRMGRTLVFLARMLHDHRLQEARGVAIDERTAALVESDGKLRVAGYGDVYFLRARGTPETCRPGTPLTMRHIEIYRAGAGSRFDLARWRGQGGNEYELTVDEGRILSSQKGGSIY